MKIKQLIIALLGIVLISCEPAPAEVDVEAEQANVKKVLSKYKKTIENLTTEGISDLFIEDSQIFESGGSEGSVKDYLGHHLGPELEEFDSFKFNDYEAKAIIEMPFAFTTESYVFVITVKAKMLADSTMGEPRVIQRKGVATAVLKKIEGDWKIMKTHSSTRAVRKSGGH